MSGWRTLIRHPLAVHGNRLPASGRWCGDPRGEQIRIEGPQQSADHRLGRSAPASMPSMAAVSAGRSATIPRSRCRGEMRYRKAVTYGFHVLLGALEEHDTTTSYEVAFAETPEATITEIEAGLNRAERVLVLWSFYSPDAKALAAELATIKAAAPVALHVAGGVHATAEPVQTLDAGWDVAAIGEGETTLLKLVDDGGDPTGVTGLAYRDGAGQVVKTGRPERLPLDSFRGFSLRWHRFNALEITRGCAFVHVLARLRTEPIRASCTQVSRPSLGVLTPRCRCRLRLRSRGRRGCAGHRPQISAGGAGPAYGVFPVPGPKTAAGDGTETARTSPNRNSSRFRSWWSVHTARSWASSPRSVPTSPTSTASMTSMPRWNSGNRACGRFSTNQGSPAAPSPGALRMRATCLVGGQRPSPRPDVAGPKLRRGRPRADAGER
jgi:hypothetical protein